MFIEVWKSTFSERDRGSASIFWHAAEQSSADDTQRRRAEEC